MCSPVVAWGARPTGRRFRGADMIIEEYSRRASATPASKAAWSAKSWTLPAVTFRLQSKRKVGRRSAAGRQRSTTSSILNLSRPSANRNTAEVGWGLEGEEPVRPPPPEEPVIDLVADAEDAAGSRRRHRGRRAGRDRRPQQDNDRRRTDGCRRRPGLDDHLARADGKAYPLDAIAMLAISDEVQAHVNATFATFAAIKVAIDSGEITTTEEVVAAFSA